MSKKLTPDQRDKANELMESAQDDLEGVIFNLVAELAAMTDERDLAKRQVELLAEEIMDHVSCWRCPANMGGCRQSRETISCKLSLAAWSKEKAEKEVGV